MKNASKPSGTVTAASRIILGASQSSNITSGALSLNNNSNLTCGALTIGTNDRLVSDTAGRLQHTPTPEAFGLLSLMA